MRRRARVSRSESTSPARVLLASGERDGDGAGSPSLPPPATTTTTTTTTSKTFAVDAADAAALVADLVVARADADLADVLATSLTVAIEVDESGAREAGGVGDGERTAVLCELVLDRTNEARGAERRWRPTAPHCTATRVVDETADEATDRADVLRVEASLSPRRHPAVRLAAVTLTRTATLVGAKPAASTNPSLPSLPPPPPLDVRAVAVVTGEDVDALARAWLARAARCAADALPATVAACGRKVPFPFFPGAGDTLVVAVVDDARLRGCCAATRVYHAEECGRGVERRSFGVPTAGVGRRGGSNARDRAPPTLRRVGRRAGRARRFVRRVVRGDDRGVRVGGAAPLGDSRRDSRPNLPRRAIVRRGV